MFGRIKSGRLWNLYPQPNALKHVFISSDDRSAKFKSNGETAGWLNIGVGS